MNPITNRIATYIAGALLAFAALAAHLWLKNEELSVALGMAAMGALGYAKQHAATKNRKNDAVLTSLAEAGILPSLT